MRDIPGEQDDALYSVVISQFLSDPTDINNNRILGVLES